VRGLFAYLAKQAHDPSSLPDAFYVRVGFALGGRLPAHKMLVSLLTQSSSAADGSIDLNVGWVRVVHALSGGH
jgi:hypothetical protein